MTTLYEYYNVGLDYWIILHSSTWIAQTFTTGDVPHTITSVKLPLQRANNPGTVTVSIRETDGDGKPTGADLTTGTTDGDTLPAISDYEWREISVTEYELQPNTKYAIVLRALDGNITNYVRWGQDHTSPSYTLGNMVYSATGGVTWITYLSYDQMFEVYGNPISVGGEFGIGKTFLVLTF